MLRRIINKLSLRTRLVLLAAFALISLVTALFIAWRLAQTTTAFRLSEAQTSVKSAARELAQAAEAIPNGYDDDFLSKLKAAPASPSPPRGKLKIRGSAPLPPHVREILTRYSDPLARLSAVTLHPAANVSGGFYRLSDESFRGFVSTDAAFQTKIENFAAVETLKNLIRQSVQTQESVSQTIYDGQERVLVAVEPLTEADELSASFALRRVSNYSSGTDLTNLLALLLLGAATIGVTTFAVFTVHDLRRDTVNITSELSQLEQNLAQKLSAPQTLEFAVIVAEINRLSRNLRLNLEKQSLLEKDLRRSERLSALGRVAAGVAHEIRNPLAAIKLKVQLAARGNYDQTKLAQTFRVVTEEIDRLDKIVKRLLEFGKAQNLETESVDLAKLLDARADFFTDLANRQRVEIARPHLARPVFVKADRKRLTEVFDNLLQNAFNAMPEGGKMSLEIETLTDRALVKFADNGVGIETAEREKIFEPFFTTRNAGTGLGLAIAREIIEAHGGKITFTSESGEGTIFTIEIPLSHTTEH